MSMFKDFQKSISESFVSIIFSVVLIGVLMFIIDGLLYSSRYEKLMEAHQKLNVNYSMLVETNKDLNATIDWQNKSVKDAEKKLQEAYFKMLDFEAEVAKIRGKGKDFVVPNNSKNDSENIQYLRDSAQKLKEFNPKLE